jgi:hypothetical protein
LSNSEELLISGIAASSTCLAKDMEFPADDPKTTKRPENKTVVKSSGT